MKKLFFLIHTEYHMMVALSLIADFFGNSDEYQIDIFQIERRKTKRFKFDINTDLGVNINYNVVIYDAFEAIFKKEGNSFVDFILRNSYDKFIMFNHHITLPVYLAKELYKKGTEIHLAPDGAKVYSKAKFAPRWSTLMAIEFNRFVRKNKLPFNFYFPSLNYASLREIDTIYIQFPESYRNKTRKTIRKFKVLHSEKAIKLNLSFFNFNINKELPNTDRNIFYVNQPIRHQAILDFEIDLLKKLTKKFDDYKLLIKLHPLSDEKQIAKFKKLDNVRLITTTFPAELYIANLEKSIVLSFWSTACLIKNGDTRVYWLYNMLEKNNLLFNNIKVHNPSDHIKLIDNIDQIV